MKSEMKKLFAAALITSAAVFTGTLCFAESAVYEKKQYSVPAGEVSNITITAKNRRIEVVPAQDDRIMLTYCDTAKEFLNVTLSENGDLSAEYTGNKAWHDYIGTAAAKENRTILLSVPDAAVCNLYLTTTNEDVLADRLALTGSAVISVNAGSILLDRLDAGTDIKLQAKNGNISGTIIGSYDVFSITSRAKKGKNNLPERKTGGSKKLDVSVNNGDIQLEFEPAAQSLTPLR